MPLTITTAGKTYPGITFRLRNQLNNEFQAGFAYQYRGPKFRGYAAEADKVKQAAETLVQIPEQGQSPIPIPPVGGSDSAGTAQQPVAHPVNLTTGEKVPGMASGSMDGKTPEDAPIFPPGSIFAPGQVWGSDNRRDDFPEGPNVTGGLETPPARIDDVKTEEVPQVAIDWGDVLGGALQDIAGGIIGGAANQVPFAGPGTFPTTAPPAEVVVDTRTGQVKKCPRRRRKRLLTPTDLSDLAALQALVGKGSSALNMAVAKAVRR